MSVDLILGAKQGATTTQRRMASTFNSYLWMLWLLFGFGLAALAVAAVRGLTADTTAEVITTGIFAGLSATTFVATFLLRPTGSMADAGPRAAWAQAVVTTFWTKLGYMNDADKALQQLDDAQTSMQRAMLSYLRSSTKAQREWVDELRSEKPDRRETETQDDQANGGTDESPTT
jgi:mannitol-specific phosphotransferase system IIBC component